MPKAAKRSMRSSCRKPPEGADEHEAHQEENERDAEESQLFAHNGHDEVVVGLWQEEEFLLACAKPRAEELAEPKA